MGVFALRSTRGWSPNGPHERYSRRARWAATATARGAPAELAFGNQQVAAEARWPDVTGAVGSSGAGAGFRRLYHRLGHRLRVEPAVTHVDPHALVGLDVAREQPFRELVLQEPLDGSPQRARASSSRVICAS